MSVAEQDVIGPAAPRWEVPEGWTVGTDGNGRTESPILTCLRNMGPSPASEIAQQLGRTTGNVSTQLRQYEEAGKARRTGRTVPGGRGGPQIEFELMPEGGERTSTDTPTEAGPGPVDKRLQALAERVGRLSTALERAEGERDGAAARADQAETALRSAEQRRQDAERRLAAAGTHSEDAEQVRPRLTEAQRRVRELEDANARLQAELDDALTADEQADDVRERHDELDSALVEVRTVLGLDAEASHDDTMARLRDVLAAPRAAAGDDRADFRRRLFDALLEKVSEGDASEDVLDRLERLADGPHGASA